MALIEVIVGNVGTVFSMTEDGYEGDTRSMLMQEAIGVYKIYAKLSQEGYGRCGGKSVTLTVDGDIEAEYDPNGVVNLDGMSFGMLVDYIDRYWPRESNHIPSELVMYAVIKIWAMDYRATGKIAVAMMFEGFLEGLYKYVIPKEKRW